MAKFRLIYCLNEYPALTQTFVRSEIEGLCERGFEVTVVAARRGTAWEQIVDRERPSLAPEILYLRDISLLKVLLGHIKLLSERPRTYVAYLRKTIAMGLAGIPWSLWVPHLIRHESIIEGRHIHTHFATRAAVTARILAGALGIPRSVTTHASDIFGRNPYLQLQLEDGRLAASTTYACEYLNQLGFPNVVRIPCGVRLPSVCELEREGNDRAPFELVSVGRLVPKKGHDDLLRAIKRLKVEGYACRLSIIGDGPDYESLVRLTEALDITNEVRFEGPRSHAEILDSYKRSSLFVLACRVDDNGESDGLPVALLEAAASGLGIVTTPVAGRGEFVGSDVAWVAAPDDSADLADKIALALSDGPERLRRIEAAKSLVRNSYTLDVQVDSVIELIMKSSPPGDGQ